MPPLRRLLAWIPLLPALGLAGCAQVPVVHQVRDPIPPALLECPREPAPPVVIRSDADVFNFAEDVRQAGADCRAKLDSIAELERQRAAAGKGNGS